MAFQLRGDESPAKGLRRLARNELRAARQVLKKTTPPDDEAIHEARKSLKKVRAVMSVIEADNGTGLGAKAKRVREINRSLAKLRDVDVMVETLTKLRSKSRRILDELTFTRLKRRLAAENEASMKAASDAGVWGVMDRELDELRQDAKRWRPAHRGFGALAPGLRQTYRKGRKAFARAVKRQQADDFHRWRKQIKALWYQLRLLEAVSSPLSKDAHALNQAEEWLGEDHNITILCAAISKYAPVPDLDRFWQVAKRYQRRLRRSAIANTRGIYHRKPRAYVRRVRRAWNEWQQQIRLKRPENVHPKSDRASA